MELLMKNIHTQRLKTKATLQMPLEADVNVSDSKPDVANIIHNIGRIRVEEIKTGANKVWVKGKLYYRILYQTVQDANALDGMDGEIAFSEEIYMDDGGGLGNNDRVVCQANLDELKISLINSRKLNIRSIVTLTPSVQKSIDRGVCTGIEISDNSEIGNHLEYRMKKIDYLECAVQKKDLLRIHEDISLPLGMDEMGSLLWKDLSVEKISFKCNDSGLNANGTLNLFVIYRTSNSGKVNWYETAIDFNSIIECGSCHDGMIADVAYSIGNEEITIKDNEDGEARTICNDMTIELEIKLYEKMSAQVLADIYGTDCEVNVSSESENFKNLYSEIDMGQKLSTTIHLDDSESGFLQICHCDCRLLLSNIGFSDNTLKLTGEANIQLLYTSLTDESLPIRQISQILPFEISHELSDENAKIDEYSLYISISQESVSIVDIMQARWQGNITAKLYAYTNHDEELLTGIELEHINPEVLERLPGFAIYYVKPGDTLWKIGKDYYVSIQRLKEMNNITSDEIHPNDRILIVK